MNCGISSYICLKFLLRRACTVTCSNGCSQVKICFLAQLMQKWGPHGPHPTFKNILFYQNMFWLSCECFSILCDALLLKSVIYNHNSCVVFITYVKIQGKHPICSKRAPWHGNKSWHESPVWQELRYWWQSFYQLIPLHSPSWLYCTLYSFLFSLGDFKYPSNGGKINLRIFTFFR